MLLDVSITNPPPPHFAVGKPPWFFSTGSPWHRWFSCVTPPIDPFCPGGEYQAAACCEEGIASARGTEDCRWSGRRSLVVGSSNEINGGHPFCRETKARDECNKGGATMVGRSCTFQCPKSKPVFSWRLSCLYWEELL